MSNNSDTVYNAPANLKSKVWKRFGFHKKDIWTKVWPFVKSVEQLLSTAVAQQI